MTKFMSTNFKKKSVQVILSYQGLDGKSVDQAEEAHHEQPHQELPCIPYSTISFIDALTPLHHERQKLYTILAFLRAKGLSHVKHLYLVVTKFR